MLSYVIGRCDGKKLKKKKNKKRENDRLSLRMRNSDLVERI